MATDIGQARIAELGHVGVRCFDVEKQLAFFTEVLGLTLTDKDDELGIYFLSARPSIEHHEFLLAKDRDVPLEGKLIQQISFRCDALSDVMNYFQKFVAAGVKLNMVVSHGSAVSVYFFDPEGNRCEVYWRTGHDVRQPFVENIDLNQTPEQILAQVKESVERYGKERHVAETYTSWAASVTEDTQGVSTAN